MSTFTTNKNIEKPGNGEYVNTWNVPVNADLDIIDAALGGVATVALTNVNVTLTTAQSQNLRLKFTGTLTGNVIISLPAVGGIWVVDNQTTGAFIVTIKTVAGGSAGVVVSQAVRSIIVADATNVYFADDRLTGTVTSVATGAGLTGGPINSSGTVSLANTAVTPGTYGSGTQVPVVAVDAQGRVTAAANTAISVLPSQTGNSGKVLTTDGSAASWGNLLPRVAASVCFNGYVAGNAVIKSQYNVASVTRLGLGWWEVTFTTPMPNLNYICTFGAKGFAALGVACEDSDNTARTVNRMRIVGFQYNSGSANDLDIINMTVFSVT